MTFHLSVPVSKWPCYRLNGPKPLTMAVSSTKRFSMDLWGNFPCESSQAVAQAEQRWCAVSSLGILKWLDEALCSITSPQSWLFCEQEVGPETSRCSLSSWNDPVTLWMPSVVWSVLAWSSRSRPDFRALASEMHSLTTAQCQHTCTLQNLLLFFVDKDPNSLFLLLGKKKQVLTASPGDCFSVLFFSCASYFSLWTY